MFEECRNQWSMSRPLLGLILLNEEYFRRLRASVVAAQPREQQQAMDRCFTNLMEGVERNVLSKNKDKYVCLDKDTINQKSYYTALDYVVEVFVITILTLY